ncbi:hypothetical protein NKR19_g4533 [Coniochaeta hoffmannii]|uniref:RING-type domain-containing protein n=1 Tax=Coniochaeta hoffmannii TaxID=91930 RepID=A0AA38VN52_9PEZI|nr:hypothetical protein NKR19_g4533 [Coniochaeta hoffmannii]
MEELGRHLDVVIVCDAPAVRPVYTSCKHIYCTDCFEALCHAKVSTIPPVIRCEGDSSGCGSVISLQELKEHLSSAAFEDILETSFKTYIGGHRGAMRYCLTPGCERLYRPAGRSEQIDKESSPFFTCPDCLSAVCRIYHVAHPDMTCAEQRADSATGGCSALALAKAELGIQD